MITLQFARGDDFGARAIQWFEHGAWSHVDAVMPDGTLLGARIEGGVLIRPADYLGAAPTLRVALTCPDAMAAAFYNAIVSQVGKPYDDTGIIGFIAGRDWEEPDKWFCSELQAWALRSCQFFRYPLAVRCNKVTPGDLLLMLSVVSPIAAALPALAAPKEIA